MRLTSALKEALSGEMTPKFLATRDHTGKPNIVPVTTITPYDDETLVFGEFMLNKTKKNLCECERVGISVMTRAFETWSLRGEFLGFETSGKAVDLINTSRLFRYNAYTSIRAAGLIRVESISPRQALTKPRLLWDFTRVSACARIWKSSSDGRVMPARVVEKFARMSAIRAVGHVDKDGAPCAFTAMACVAAGPNRLLVSDPLFHTHEPQLAPDTEAAVCIITMDPIAYQVKGVYTGTKLGMGIIEVRECYSASPPLLGERIDGRS